MENMSTANSICRKAYRLAQVASGMSRADFREAVEVVLSMEQFGGSVVCLPRADTTPVQWVKAARRVAARVRAQQAAARMEADAAIEAQCEAWAAGRN